MIGLSPAPVTFSEGSLAGMRIDVFTPSIEFSWEAAKTASRVLIFETEVSVRRCGELQASPRTMMMCPLVAGRWRGGRTPN
jgi:hypothetical protein